MPPDDPWRGMSVWQDFASADAERDARPQVVDIDIDVTVHASLSQVEHDALIAAIEVAVADHLSGTGWGLPPDFAALTAIADREFEEAHRVAMANAEAEARQSRVERWVGWALWPTLIGAAACSMAAMVFTALTLLT